MTDMMLPEAIVHPPPHAYPGEAAKSGEDALLAAIVHPRWVSAAIDLLDFGLMIVADGRRIVLCNSEAEAILREGRLMYRITPSKPTFGADSTELLHAIDTATSRGLQRMVMLDRGRVAVAAVPLGTADGLHAVVLLIGRPSICTELALNWFARGAQLTVAEEKVLRSICTGSAPADIAREHGVAVSTVRTQIESIRLKSGVATIRDLIHTLARLPPMRTRSAITA